MIWREYPDYTEKFIVHRYTGVGVMEDPYVEHEVIFRTNSKKEAVDFCSKYRKENNSPEDFISGWCDNTAQTNVNTLSDLYKTNPRYE